MGKLNRSTFKLEKDRRFVWNSKSLSVVAFLFPFLVLTFAYAALQTFPFGDRHILTVDLFHQYAPFLQLMRDKILAGGSPFYSLTSGLGVNFFAIFAYYLASPLNLIFLLFPAPFLTEGVFLVSLIKVGLMGFAFFLFLQVSYRRKGVLAVAFSTFYALSGFTMAYSWNIMWLDSLILLPVVALALVRLIRDGKWLLFPVSITLLLISNYYSAFFVCIFVALYFPILLFRYTEGDKIRRKLFVTCKVIVLAAVGVALSAIMLYPTVRSLLLTSAAGDAFPKTFELSGKPLAYLAQLFPFLQPTVRSGAPNLYSGLPVLFLLPVYFLSSRIRLREKLLNGFLLLFIFLSFDTNVLNFLWHGMHYPNQLPYRYSFVAIFLLLAIAYDGLRSTREFRPTELGLLGVCLAFVAPVVIALDSEIKTAAWTQWGTIAFIVLYAILFSSFRTRSFKPRLQVNLLLAVMLLEVTLSTFSGIFHIGQNEYYGARDGYSTGPVVASIREAVRQTKAMDEDKSFYRMEIKPHKTSNDPALYGLNGLSLFASTSPKAPVTFFKNAGYQNNGINSYQYRGSTLFCDSLFRIKYVITRDTLPYEDKERVVTLGNSHVTVYRNDDIFPVAFIGKPALTKFKSSYGNPFNTQGDLADAIIGEKLHLFSELKAVPREGEDLRPSSSTNTKFRFTRPDGKSNWDIELTWMAEQEGPHYLSLDIGTKEIDEATVEVNGTPISIDKKKKGISEIGSLVAGDEIKLLIRPSETVDSGSLDVHLASLDMKALRQLRDFAHENEMTVIDMKEDQIYGTVSCEEDGVLFVSIPYDPGWSAKVDGEYVDIETVDDALMAIPVSAGTHDVFMYFRPVGYATGVTITCYAAGVLALLLLSSVLYKKFRRKKDPEELLAHDDSEEDAENVEIEDPETPEDRKAEEERASAPEPSPFDPAEP